MYQREHTQVRRPVAPPIDLNSGRLDMSRAALAGAYVLGALVVVMLGLWIFGRSVSVLWQFCGLALTAIGLILGAIVLAVSVGEWLDHRRRVADWHEESLESYRKLQSAETIEHISELHITIDNPGHVLLAALWCYWRTREGVELPHSVRQLAGPVFLANRRSAEITKLTAEQLGRRFAELGLVEGRMERYAGHWIPESADEVMELVLRNW